MLFNPIFFWLILMVLFAIIEVFTLTFALLSFSVAAGITGLVSLLGVNLYVQLIVFSTCSILTLLFIRPFIHSLFFKSNQNTKKIGVDAFIGQTHKLLETVNNMENTGKIKIGSEIWSVRAQDDQEIMEGEFVIIKSIEGTTLYVEKTVEQTEKK